GLTDCSANVRLFFCQGLGLQRNKDPDVPDVIAQVLDDPSREVRLTAVRALGFLDSRRHLPAIAKLYAKDSKEDDEDWCFAECLSKMGDIEISLACVQTSMLSRNWNVRFFAVSALKNIKSERVVPIAIRLLVPELRQTLAEMPTLAGCDRIYAGLYNLL